jgi:hypothetical protein
VLVGCHHELQLEDPFEIGPSLSASTAPESAILIPVIEAEPAGLPAPSVQSSVETQWKPTSNAFIRVLCEGICAVEVGVYGKY